jgi:multidrug efflux pump subunit AcrA (membrane-fusion protein)
MRTIFAAALSLGLAGLVACSAGAQPDAAVQPTAIPAVQASSNVIAEGKVVPASSVDLSFEAPGVVAEILVAEGDRVEASQPLARLDTRDLSLRVEQAQVGLEQAQSDYDRLLEGATAEQVAAAEAEVARAQGSLQAAQGGVTAADMEAARAELTSARARLAELQAGADGADAQAAQAGVDRARANLQAQRDALSQAKTDAQLRMDTAANTLRNAQDEYSRIYWQNRELEKLPGDLPQEALDREAAALRAVSDAETAIAQAQVALEQARLAEISGIAAAEADLRDAEARQINTLAPAEADAVAAARAQVASAQARLAKLTGGEHAGSVAAAEAGVTSARANLAELQTKPSDATLDGAAARVRGARVALAQAQLALDKATLNAPVAGTVAELNLTVGEVPTGSDPVIVLADFSSWQVETDDLTELNVVKVREGDQVTLAFDALPGFELPGTVDRIRPVGKNHQGDIVYTVVVKPNSWDERLRWNMTASVQIAGAGQ